LRKFVYLAGGEACAESIVDINYCHAAAAAIGALPARRPDRRSWRRIRYWWAPQLRASKRDQPRHWEERLPFRQRRSQHLRVELFKATQQTVHTRYADIGNALDVIAHDFRGDRGFFGNRQIARAGTGDNDRASAPFGVTFLNRDTSGQFVMDGRFKFFFARDARVVR